MSVSLREQEIQGALARGYCTERNSKKVLDPDLIMDMATEVARLFSIEEELRTIICKHTSEMLDNPDKYGIYPTTKFYNDLISALIGKCATPTFSGEKGLHITCDFCGCELLFPGALLFSPPDENGNCKKSHICTTCAKVQYKPTEQKELSACCNAPMTVEGEPDFPGDTKPITQYYSCTECKRPCDRAGSIPAEKKECELRCCCGEVELESGVVVIGDVVHCKSKPCYMREPKPKDRIEKLDRTKFSLGDAVLTEAGRMVIVDKINELIRHINKES